MTYQEAQELSVSQLRRMYPFIYAWGSEMRSYASYTTRQARLAAETDAPHDAVYPENDEGTVWKRAANVRNDAVRSSIYARAANHVDIKKSEG